MILGWNILDIVICFLIGLSMVIAILSIYRNKKKGKGCCGTCTGCNQCSSCSTPK